MSGIDGVVNAIHYSAARRRAKRENASSGREIVPKLDDAKRQDRLQGILDAAEQILVRDGYSAASISDVARLAGISDGLIYRYFAGKQELRDQVLARFYGRILARAQGAIAAHAGFEARLLALIETHLAALRDEPGLCRLFIAELRSAADYDGSAMQDLNRRYTRLLTATLRQGIGEGAVRADADPRLVRDMVYGGMEHVAWRSVHAGEPLDVAQTARAILRLLLPGLSAA